MKEVDLLVTDRDIYTGAALIGDGHIALIVDLDCFCQGIDEDRLALKSYIAQQGGALDSEEDDSRDYREETLLLAKLGTNRQVAIPLELVNRLEKFSRSDLESSSGLPAVQYRESVLPLVHLSEHITDVAATTADELQVIVYSNQGVMAGIVVDDILDIVDARYSLEQIGTLDAIAGTAIVRDQVTDIIDLDGLLIKAAPYLLQQGDDLPVKVSSP